MKSFLQFISESTAVQQAKRMGLVGDGHGGWYDKQGEFVAKTEGGKLKFYNKRQRQGQDPAQSEKEKNLSAPSSEPAQGKEEPAAPAAAPAPVPQQAAATQQEPVPQGEEDPNAPALLEPEPVEKTKGTLTIAFGRFNPPTTGHQKLLDNVAKSSDDAISKSAKLGFPIIVRPSYVLGGQGMKIVINKDELESHVVDLLRKIPNNKLLLDHYLDGAIEAEADAISDGKDVYIIGIMEHIEPCGIHSGDSNATLPVFNLGEYVVQQIKDHTNKIAKELKTVGLINIQFAVKNDKVYVIEANPRASRTVPFIAKAYNEPYVNYATKIMLGKNKISDFKFESKLDGFAIKQPVFSFSKFPNVNKNLGPEMKSTGESILFIDDLKDDDFYEIYSRRKMYLTK